ncbi:MAG: L-rhamnose mutarotase [Candidatus Aminicenantaceae bacterium]
MAKNTEKQRRYCSLIGLLPEYEERYLILHRHTFPGVLERIRESNIRNYSIFLREGMLFSYYKYIGSDYQSDMQKIADDPVTRDWWKLTDPMQSPLESRGQGEWWAGMPELMHLGPDKGHPVSPVGAQRFAYVAGSAVSDPVSATGIQDLLQSVSIHTLSLFIKDGDLYCYLEYTGKTLDRDRLAWETALTQALRSITPEAPLAVWDEMREVFHTD